jgi:hypothetical protein
VVARRRHNRCIQYLSASRDIALPGQITVKQPEQFLNLACPRQRVSIKPHRPGIGHTVAKAKRRGTGFSTSFLPR